MGLVTCNIVYPIYHPKHMAHVGRDMVPQVCAGMSLSRVLPSQSTCEISCLRACKDVTTNCVSAVFFLPSLSAYNLCHQGNRHTTWKECWMGPAVMKMAALGKQREEENSTRGLLRSGPV